MQQALLHFCESSQANGSLKLYGYAGCHNFHLGESVHQSLPLIVFSSLCFRGWKNADGGGEQAEKTGAGMLPPLFAVGRGAAFFRSTEERLSEDYCKGGEPGLAEIFHQVAELTAISHGAIRFPPFRTGSIQKIFWFAFLNCAVIAITCK